MCHYTSFQISENFCYNSNYERYNDKKVGYPFFMVLTCSGFGKTVLAADFQVGAEHAIVVEADSGRVLYEKDAKTPDAIASLTKLVTAYLVLDKVKSGQLQLSDQVNLSDYAFELTKDRSLSNVPFDKKLIQFKTC